MQQRVRSILSERLAQTGTKKQDKEGKCSLVTGSLSCAGNAFPTYFTACREIEAKILAELVSQMQIEGGYAKPTWKSLFAVQVAIAPFRFARWVYTNIAWFVKFTVLKQPYGDAENVYRTRRALGLSESQWSFLKDEEREEMLARYLHLLCVCARASSEFSAVTCALLLQRAVGPCQPV